MNLDEKKRLELQNTSERPCTPTGEALGVVGGADNSTTRQGIESSRLDHLMELVVESQNMRKALQRVKGNKGSPGIDGMRVGELEGHLRHQWSTIREQLLNGTYRPKAVKRVEIAKPNGGTRILGIPTVTDRLIQQAMLQVLQPQFDPTFSDHSHGFRPNRSAHGAILEAQKFIQSGRRWVVDIDLEKFFDRVNHDILMGRLAKRIGDKRMLKLIRGYLNAGVMVNGVVRESGEGTPQGGPLSPLLANLLLDEVDKELEKRGHKFVRYADDCNVYVRTEKAARRVLESLKKCYARLKLKVNEEKSRVREVTEAKFLGYSFWISGWRVKRRIAEKALKTMRDKVRLITSRTRGQSVEEMAKELKAYLPGWKNYFRLAQTPGIWLELDKWIRHRLRAIQLKQWKTGPTTFDRVRQLKFSRDVAAMLAGAKGSWWRSAQNRAANIVMPNSYFDLLGVPRLAL